MKDSHLQLLRDTLVFGLLIGIGVAGRWAQPQWCFTPTAAAAVFAGFYYSHAALAALVPLAILAISDLILPAYDSTGVFVATYSVMTLPVFFGKLLCGKSSRWDAAWRWGVCGLLPATLFYLVTNFAVWVFQSDYEKTLFGLVQCYWAAVPFFRWMLAGDVLYLAMIFTCWAMADTTLDAVVRTRSSRVAQRINAD